MNTAFQICVVFCHGGLAAMGLRFPNIGVHSETSVTHCLNWNTPLELPDPFPPHHEQLESFVELRWDRYVTNVSNPRQDVREKLLTVTFGSTKRLMVPERSEIFQFWGLKLLDVQLTDSAEYIAYMTTTANTSQAITHVAVKAPPTLKSDKLGVTRHVDEVTGDMTLTCGTLNSPGSPPVEFLWRAPNGTVIRRTAYKDGGVTLVLTKDEDKGPFSCELDLKSSAAECIPKKDLPLWGHLPEGERERLDHEMAIVLWTMMVIATLVTVVIIGAAVYFFKQLMDKETNINPSRLRDISKRL